MIKWREGKAGFSGASKRLIKGVFDYVYTVTTEPILIVVSPNVISINPGNREVLISEAGRSINIGRE